MAFRERETLAILLGEGLRPTHADALFLYCGDLSALPNEGWKIHVAAHVYNFTELLPKVVPPIGRCAFKVVRSVSCLRVINRGAYGRFSVGKAITVYPCNVEEALEVLARLENACKGMSAPLVLTDRVRVRPSIVSYRYGSFGGISLFSGLLRRPAITRPDGTLVRDWPPVLGAVPSWLKDPFGGERSPLEQAQQVEDRIKHLLGAGYQLSGTLQQHSRYVLRAVPPTASGLCSVILKMPLVPGDWDTINLLRHEVEVLKWVAGYPCGRYTPRLLDWKTRGDDCVVVMEEREGITLRVLAPFRRYRLLRIGHELRRAIHSFRRAEVTLNDLSPNNVLISPSGTLSFVDLEHASIGRRSPPVYPLTVGYGDDLPRYNLCEDLMAAGRLMIFMWSGVELSCAEDLSKRENRRWLLEGGPGALAEFIEGLTSGKLEARTEKGATPKALVTSNLPQLAELAAAEGLREVVDALVQKRSKWTSYRLEPEEEYSLYSGRLGSAWVILESRMKDAGMLLASKTCIEESLRKADIRWPGLYVGCGGAALAAVRCGLDGGWQGLTNRGLRLACRIGDSRHVQPDLLSGSAGRLCMHLRLFRWTKDCRQLQYAREVAALLADFEFSKRGGFRWPGLGWEQPEEGQALGLAHGLAGVLEALLAYEHTVRDQSTRDAVEDLQSLLLSRRTPEGAWPTRWTGGSCRHHWCHGSVGVGLFFCRAFQYTRILRYRELAEECLEAASRQSFGNPSICHGVGGVLALALAAHSIGIGKALTFIRMYGSFLMGLRGGSEGRARWQGDRGLTTSGYMVGSAGVVHLLEALSLGKELLLPHQFELAS